MNLRIEPLRPDAAPASIEGGRHLLGEYRAFMENATGFRSDRLAREIEDLPLSYSGEMRLLLAFRDAEPVGCIAFRPLPEMPGQGVGEVKRMWVTEKARGSGIAAALTQAVLELARQEGYRAASLDTEPATMPAAFRLYQRLGFRPCPPYREATEGIVYLRYDLV